MKKTNICITELVSCLRLVFYSKDEEKPPVLPYEALSCSKSVVKEAMDIQH